MPMDIKFVRAGLYFANFQSDALPDHEFKCEAVEVGMFPPTQFFIKTPQRTLK